MSISLQKHTIHKYTIHILSYQSKNYQNIRDSELPRIGDRDLPVLSRNYRGRKSTFTTPHSLIVVSRETRNLRFDDRRLDCQVQALVDEAIRNAIGGRHYYGKMSYKNTDKIE